MSGAPADPDSQIDALAAMVRLPIAAEYRDGVRQFLAIARQMAEVLDAVPLDENELAPAPIFRLPRSTETDADA